VASPHHLRHLEIPFELAGGGPASQGEAGNGDATTWGTVFRLKDNLNFSYTRSAMDGFRAP
jgi:hypothetical protein